MGKSGLGIGRIVALAMVVAGCGDSGVVPPTAEIQLSTDTLTVAEGGSATFTIQLSEPVQVESAVSISVANSAAATVSPAVLTFAVGDTGPKTITVSGSNDNNLADEMTDLVVAKGDVSPQTVRLTVDDDDTQAFVVSTSALTMAESASATFTVALAFAPAQTTTVTIAPDDTQRLGATPTTLTFDATTFSAPQTVTLASADDADVAQNVVGVAITSAGIANSEVEVTITDDDQQNLLFTPAALALTEGGAAGTFQVRLAQMPATTVTVNLASSDTGAATISPATLTFTPANYGDGAMHVVTVTPVSDTDTADETLSVNLTGGLTGSFPITVADDDDQRIVATPTMLTVTEGATGTVGVHLAYNPGATVSVTIGSSDATIAATSPTTLTFDASNYGTDQQVTVTGVEDADLADESASLALTMTGVPMLTVPVSVDDNDTQDITLSYAGAPNTLTLPEGTSSSPSTAIVGVRLAYQPAAATTVTITSNNADLTLSATMLTFSPTDYNVVQNVTLTAVDEADLVDETATVTFAVASGPTRTLTVDIPDTDVQGFHVVPTTLPVIVEGTSTMFQLNLNFPPASAVSATIASSNPKVTVNGATSTAVTIGTGNAAQSITVLAVADPDAQDETSTLTISAPGIPDRVLNVTVDDDETMAFVISPMTANADGQRVAVMEQGADGTFTVSLSAVPTQAATVTITPSQTGQVTVSSNGSTFAATTTIAFDPTNTTPKTITVRGLADPNLVDEVFTITVHGPTSLGAADAPVWIQKVEDDVEAIVTTPAPPGPIVVTEGTTGTQLRVRLEYQPVMATQVTLTPSAGLQVQLDGAAVGAPINLLFTTTSWEVEQIVTVTTPSDVDQVADAPGSIAISSPALATKTVNVTLVDDDHQAIQVSTTTLAIDEDPAGDFQKTFTVRLAYQPTAADEQVTLTLPASATGHMLICDGNVMLHGGPMCATQLTLFFSNAMGTPGGWDVPQTVYVRSVPDADVISEVIPITLASDLGATGATVTVTITDDDTQVIATDNTERTITEEGSGSGSNDDEATFLVKLTQNPTTTLTVTSSSGDTGAVTAAPATLSYTSANYGTNQTLTVTAVPDDDVRDEVVTVTLSSPDVMDDKLLTVRVRDNDVQQILHSGTLEITEGDAGRVMQVRLKQQPTDPVTVTVTALPPTSPSGIAAGQHVNVSAGGSAPATTATLTFTASTWNVDQPVTVTAPPDADLDYFSGDLQLAITSAQGTTAPEGAPVTTHAYQVSDDDRQTIVTALSPAVLINSAQELGPYVEFTVALGARPRLGATDTVMLTAPGAVRFVESMTATRTVVFSGTNWAVPQTVRWYLESGSNTNFASTIALQLDESGDAFPFTGAYPAVNATHAVRGYDRSQTILGSSNQAGFSGATVFTQRANVAWAPDGTAEGRVAFTARTAVSGGSAQLGFTQRDLASVSAGPTLASGGLEATTEIVLYNPDGAGTWDVFTSAANGFVFARYTLAGNVVLAPTTFATPDATDLAVARNGSVYGAVYRRQDPSRGNLYFRTITIATGAASSEQITTTANSFNHFHPMLHTVDGFFDPGTGLVSAPYLVIYNENGANKAVRTTATGAPLAAQTFTAGFPGQNFSSSMLYSGHIWAAHVRNVGAGQGDNEVWISHLHVNTSGLPTTVENEYRLTTASAFPMSPVSPPVIADNINSRGEIAVAYDTGLAGINRVGVVLWNGSPTNYLLGSGSDDVGLYPAIAWAGDRWVLRYQSTDPATAGIRLRVGSFDGAASTPPPTITSGSDSFMAAARRAGLSR